MKTIPIFQILFLATTVFLLLTVRSQAQEWHRVTEVPASQTTALFQKGDTLLAAGANRIYFTKNGGSNWDSTSVIDNEVDFIEAVVLVQNRLFAGTVVDGVFRSDNGGQTWLADNNGLLGPGALSIKRFAARGDSLYVATSGSGVFVKKISTNSAWSKYSLNLPWQNVESIINIDGMLLAGAGGNATFSRNGYPSSSWEEVPFAEFDGSLNFFLGAIRVGDVLLGAGNQGLYRSTDLGETWTHHNPGTGILGTAKFVNADGKIIANLAKPAGFSFIQFTDDKGLHWENFEPVLSGSFGFDLAFLNGQLYSSRDDGLWRIDLATPVNEAIGGVAVLSNNYPNPFSLETAIPVSLSRSSWLDVSIFDANGVKVETVWQGEKPAGKHEFRFWGSTLPKGFYYCRLSTPTTVISQKMIKAG